MCFHCTRSSTCGTHCFWVTPLSPSVSVWPYCSSSGTVSWLMASMSASYSSLTCQVKIWAGFYIFVNAVSSLYPSFHVHSILRLGRCYYDNMIINNSLTASFIIYVLHALTFFRPSLNRTQRLSICICRRLFFIPQGTNVCWCVWVNDILKAGSSALLHRYTLSLMCCRHATLCSASVKQSIAAPWELYAREIPTSMVLQHSHHLSSSFSALSPCLVCVYCLATWQYN